MLRVRVEAARLKAGPIVCSSSIRRGRNQLWQSPDPGPDDRAHSHADGLDAARLARIWRPAACLSVSTWRGATRNAAWPPTANCSRRSSRRSRRATPRPATNAKLVSGIRRGGDGDLRREIVHHGAGRLDRGGSVPRAWRGAGARAA